MTTVLLTNDDGPPNARESPYVFGLYQHLTKTLGWNVKVVLPNSQRSWIGKAYQIREITTGKYYYPKEPDGYGETSNTSRPLKEGEIAEWILLDGTPATCSNVAIHNLYPGQIDLCISGANLGRNSSSAFALSSGTVGAALSSALSTTKAIAISYGTVIHPTPKSYFDPARILGVKIIKHLWDNWGPDSGGLRLGEVDLYNVNIPLIEELLSEEGLEIYWTTMWRKSYGRLFKQIDKEQPSAARPDVQVSSDHTTSLSERPLAFKWSPQMEGLITPDPTTLVEGTDGWAISCGAVSVTPLRASFAEPPSDAQDIEERLWKVKL